MKKPRFTMTHVAYRPDSAEIYNTGKQAGRMTHLPGTKCNLAMLLHWMPLFKQEPIEAQLEALETFREGWNWVR